MRNQTLDKTVGGSCSGSPTRTSFVAPYCSGMRLSISVHWHACQQQNNNNNLTRKKHHKKHKHCTKFHRQLLLQDATLSQGGPRDAPYSIWDYGCSEKICESLATPTANFPDILMDLFRSIRKKNCGSGSADNRVRSPHTVCAACRVTLGFPATTLARREVARTKNSNTNQGRLSRPGTAFS